MQKIVRVKLPVEAYVREQFHRQMRPPSQCPNCGRFHRLWGHAYYERGATDSCGKVIAFWVRRFRCTYCRVTVSCLPCIVLTPTTFSTCGFRLATRLFRLLNVPQPARNGMSAATTDMLTNRFIIGNYALWSRFATSSKSGSAA